MEVIKAMVFGAVVSGCVAVVVGSQGTAAGPLAIEAVDVDDFISAIDLRIYWSWPMFLAGTGLFWALSLLQR